MNIDEIKARVEKATPGPWSVWPDEEDDGYDTFSVLDSEDGRLGLSGFYGRNALENAEFIAHARQDIPDLLEALTAANAEIERLKDSDQKWDDQVIYYRNLAIRLGAAPDTMLTKYDRQLAEHRDPEGDAIVTDEITETQDIWHDLESLENELTAANAEIERLKAQFAAETLRTSKLTNVVAATRERLTLAGDHIVVWPARRGVCSLCYLATMAHEALADTIYANDTVYHSLIESWERDRAAAILTEGGGE